MLPHIIRFHRSPPDPDEALFRGIRRGLTLWYGAVLSAVLLLFGVALYLVETQALLGPINGDLEARAATVRQAWQEAPGSSCPGAAAHAKYWVCFAPSGTILNHNDEIDDAPNLTTRSFALGALQAGRKSDTIDGGGDAGMVRRYAQVIRRPGGGILGIVVLAEPVQGELDALHLLLILLLIFGVLALLAGTLGGLFLSGRTLEPARLAVRRQQAFIADASHELRTPLTLVRADADLLQQERNRLTDQGAMLLDDIVTEVTQMAALSANMLALTELGSGALQLDHDVVDLAEVASSVAQRASAFARASGITVSSEPAGPVLVIGDRLLLEQASLIVVDNAIKYNRPGGGVQIKVRAEGSGAILEVQDTGIGIASEHLAHLSERFYRVDKSRSRQAGGAGLGLSITQGIARAHVGKLIIESDEGAGTRVSLVLPLAKPT